MAMDWISLGRQVVALGAPTIGAALGGPVGAEIGGVIAGVLGVEATPGAISEAITANPGAISTIEANPPVDVTEWLLIHARAAAALAKSEGERETWFSWAWRPAMSWLLIILWAWAILVLPLINALSKLGIPLPPYDQILAFSGLWLAIYGGGHTIKAIYDGSKGR